MDATARWFTILAGLFLVSAFALLGAGCNFGFQDGQDIGVDDDDDLSDDDDLADDDDQNDDDDDDTQPSGDVDITSIAPSSGAIAGQYEVIISGTDFTTAPDTTVWFGSTTAQVLNCTTGQCTVVVPATTQAGSVQVSLENANGTAVEADGFEYLEDLSGLASYFAEVVRIEYLYPEVITPTPVDEAWAYAIFFAPQNFDMVNDSIWGGALPATGSCISVDMTTLSGVQISAYDAGTSVTLQGTSTFNLLQDGIYYLVDGLSVGQYSAGNYTLSIPGGANLSSETIPNAVTAPATYNVIPNLAPYEVTSNQFMSGLSFAMQGGNCSSAVLAMNMYIDTGGPSLEYDETILCHYASGANMDVPAASTQQFPTAAAAIIDVECYSERTSPVASGADMIGVGRAIVSGVMYVN